MATSFMGFYASGGLLHHRPEVYTAAHWSERDLFEAFTQCLPKAWGAILGPSDDVGIYCVLAYRSRKQLGQQIADYLAFTDRDFEGYLSHSRFVLTDMGQDRSRNGLCVFEGDGMDLGQHIRFWTGVNWMGRKAPNWPTTDTYEARLAEAIHAQLGRFATSKSIA